MRNPFQIHFRCASNIWSDFKHHVSPVTELEVLAYFYLKFRPSLPSVKFSLIWDLETSKDTNIPLHFDITPQQQLLPRLLNTSLIIHQSWPCSRAASWSRCQVALNHGHRARWNRSNSELKSMMLKKNETMQQAWLQLPLFTSVINNVLSVEAALVSQVSR